ncbi:hypothetical protein NFI96_008910, partial [Prochilodus magdalenae]
EHSLYYTYTCLTALSKDLTLPGIYEFLSGWGLLDDQVIDYYNNLHVLQWRHGCEIDDSNGQVTFLRGSSDYGYDGEDFLSFDIKTMTWIAVVPAAVPTKMKWDSVAILNQYTSGYLEKECVDWLTKFLKYREEAQEKHSPPEVHVFMKKSIINPDKLTLTCLATGFYPKDVVLRLRKNHTALPEHLLTSSRVIRVMVDRMQPPADLHHLFQLLQCHLQEAEAPPEVHVFTKKSIISPDKLTLTCLATGFYPKDVVLRLRKNHTALPEYLLTSSGVRPNEDGTYQLRKSVEIQEDHTADYDCYVTHSSIQEPVIKQWEKHSLYYIYTALSRDIGLPGIYEFTALGLLDDREIDYYNSKDQMKVPKQDWMKEKMQNDYWEKGTQSRKSKEQWFKVNLDIMMHRMRHNKADLHVLQWRHGCEIDYSNGQVTFLRGSSDYGYDGEDFLSFDIKTMTWIAVVPAALPTKRKWDNVTILNQYTKGYLEKECVDWLTKFTEYGKEELRKHSPPDVYVFVKKPETNSNKLTLTCLATGFYPKDVVVRLWKSNISLSEHLLTSSGVRPNEDGTYQLRKSVEIQKEHRADYHCYVTHSSFKESIITKLGGESSYGQIGGVTVGVTVVVVAILAAVVGVIYICRRKRTSGEETPVLGDVVYTQAGEFYRDSVCM